MRVPSGRLAKKSFSPHRWHSHTRQQKRNARRDVRMAEAPNSSTRTGDDHRMALAAGDVPHSQLLIGGRRPVEQCRHPDCTDSLSLAPPTLLLNPTYAVYAK